MAAAKAEKSTEKNSDRKETMAGLAKGLAILESFAESSGKMTLTEAAKATSLTRATARRCLLTLAEQGYVAYDGRYFTPLPRLLKLGYAFLSSTPLARSAEPVLQSLQTRAGEAISLSILDQNEVVFIVRSAPRRMNTLGPSVGSRLPIWCSASGRMLLSGLDDATVRQKLSEVTFAKRTPRTLTSVKAISERVREARTRGYATVDEELELGMRSLAVPVRNFQGQIVAALSVSVNAAQSTLDQMVSNLLPLLREGTKLLSI
jgi:IclR family transcriptional regulator, pca regulon regulatory protein